MVPELVHDGYNITNSTDGLASGAYKAVSYRGVIPILVEAVKHQRKSIQALQAHATVQEAINQDHQALATLQDAIIQVLRADGAQQQTTINELRAAVREIATSISGLTKQGLARPSNDVRS